MMGKKPRVHRGDSNLTMLARGDGSKLLLKGLARRVATARVLKLLPCQMLRGEREREKVSQAAVAAGATKVPKQQNNMRYARLVHAGGLLLEGDRHADGSHDGVAGEVLGILASMDGQCAKRGKRRKMRHFLLYDAEKVV
jgi:hypothetical protein